MLSCDLYAYYHALVICLQVFKNLNSDNMNFYGAGLNQIAVPILLLLTAVIFIISCRALKKCCRCRHAVNAPVSVSQIRSLWPRVTLVSGATAAARQQRPVPARDNTRYEVQDWNSEPTTQNRNNGEHEPTVPSSDDSDREIRFAVRLSGSARNDLERYERGERAARSLDAILSGSGHFHDPPPARRDAATMPEERVVDSQAIGDDQLEGPAGEDFVNTSEDCFLDFQAVGDDQLEAPTAKDATFATTPARSSDEETDEMTDMDENISSAATESSTEDETDVKTNEEQTVLPPSFIL